MQKYSRLLLIFFVMITATSMVTLAYYSTNMSVQKGVSLLTQQAEEEEHKSSSEVELEAVPHVIIQDIVVGLKAQSSFPSHRNLEPQQSHIAFLKPPSLA